MTADPTTQSSKDNEENSRVQTEASESSSTDAALPAGQGYSLDDAQSLDDGESRADTHDAETPALPRRPREREPEEEPPLNAQVASLHAMFPDFDPSIIQSVLESVDGSQDRAVDVLLGMSDPSHVPQDHHPQAPVLSQTDLDEQLARRLMLEEEQQQEARWQAQQPGRGGGALPYQARTGGRHAQPAYNPEAGAQRDTMAEVQDQFLKIAESGKRTFGNLVSKVRQKMQEFDQSKAQQGGGGGGGASQPGGSNSRWSSDNTSVQQYEARSHQQQHQQQQQQQQQSYYDPNPRSYSPDDSREGSPTGEDLITLDHGHLGSPPTAPAPAAVQGTATAPPPTTGPPRPPSTGAGSGPSAPNIDYSKIGLLPKRPVSLLRDPPSAQPQTRPSNEEEELEYMENPFEEER